MPLWAQLGFQLLHGLLSALVGYRIGITLIVSTYDQRKVGIIMENQGRSKLLGEMP